MFAPFSTPFMIGGVQLPADILCLIVAAILGVAYGVVIGRDRAVLVLLSLYMAFCVVTNAPVISLVSQGLGFGRVPALRVAWFLGVFVIIFLILWRSSTLKSMARDRGNWLHAGLFGVLEIGFLVSALLFLLPVEWINRLPRSFQIVFLHDLARSLWFIAPIVGLAALGRPAGDDVPLEDIA
jgi:hypothetical protein